MSYLSAPICWARDCDQPLIYDGYAMMGNRTRYYWICPTHSLTYVDISTWLDDHITYMSESEEQLDRIDERR